MAPDVPKIEWTLRVVSDPYGCETSATYGIPAGMVSVYRRPLPSANVIDLDPNGDTPRGISSTRASTSCGTRASRTSRASSPTRR